MSRKPDMAKLGPSHGTRGERIAWARLQRYVWAFANDGTLPGSPDVSVVDPSRRLAVFVDGRHWHDPATAARHARPHHKTDWVAKAKRNRARDLKVDRELAAMGFLVVRIWDDAVDVPLTWIRLEKLIGIHELRHGRDEPAGGVFVISKSGYRQRGLWTPATARPFFVGSYQVI